MWRLRPSLAPLRLYTPILLPSKLQIYMHLTLVTLATQIALKHSTPSRPMALFVSGKTLWHFGVIAAKTHYFIVISAFWMHYIWSLNRSFYPISLALVHFNFGGRPLDKRRTPPILPRFCTVETDTDRQRMNTFCGQIYHTLVKATYRWVCGTNSATPFPRSSNTRGSKF